ncbi:hypothetical protein GOP47_0025498 [Adiantum capillus-veneris]|uniref:Uncharacterized protein n=1 Tax=Adiantum capillus-veneris TaxID=13818 RepID=A0A9D4U0H2_ADICA|nr:hypothetical protein GOP47_0025498 [Adiantum capillus-veneris]
MGSKDAVKDSEQPPPRCVLCPDSCSLAAKGDAMQTCGSELTRRMDELRQKRDELGKALEKEEAEKASIQKDLLALTRRLAEIDASLSRKQAYSSEYEKTIEEVEAAYSIIMESSQTLLHVLKMETTEILKKT